MTATKQGARGKAAGASLPTLPPVTVARFEESLLLVERIASQERAGFLGEMQAFRQQHRDVTRRPLTAEEATRFTAAMADAYRDEAPEDVASRLQGSELYAYDDPAPRDVLVAAGLATAPAMVRSVRKFVALMELTAGEFEQAYEDDTLQETVDEAAKRLGSVELAEARARTVAAMEHWARQAGVDSGEAMRRLAETVMGALEQAAIRVTAQASPALSHLSTASPEPTAGPAETSSTTPATATP